jgi:hypothetical protein
MTGKVEVRRAADQNVLPLTAEAEAKAGLARAA